MDDAFKNGSQIRRSKLDLTHRFCIRDLQIICGELDIADIEFRAKPIDNINFNEIVAKPIANINIVKPYFFFASGGFRLKKKQ